MQRKAFHESRLLISLSAVVLCAAIAVAQNTTPDWWAERGVLTANAAHDYAALNVGQLKHLAYSAWLELDALPGGAGFGPTFTNGLNNFAAVNMGQLKDTAAPFYDRLGMVYPWAGGTAADYAIANIGQAKVLFSFGPDDYDLDHDGLLDVDETARGTDPLNPDSDYDGMLDGWETDWGLNPLSGLTGTLLGWWQFREGAGTNSLDYSGCGNNVVIVRTNGISWAEGAPLGGSLCFMTAADAGGRGYDGGYVCAQALANIALPTGFTVAAWVFAESFASNATVLTQSSDHGSWTNGFSIYGGSTNAALSFYAGDWKNGSNAIESGVGVTGVWLHVCSVYDGSNASVYVNGQLRGYSTNVTGSISSGDALWIGSTFNVTTQFMWNGKIADARFYRSALSSNDVLGVLEFMQDPDGDGLSNQQEHNYGTNPHVSDTDGDGMWDGWEIKYNLDPLDLTDGDGDIDCDGLVNSGEFGYVTDPTITDSDRDGMWDYMEVIYGYDPNDPDNVSPDSDNDGLRDFDELVWGTDPYEKDTDRDGLDDYVEIYNNGYQGQNHTNITVYGIFVCGTDPTVSDCDDDGINDGSEKNYGTNPWNADTDTDGLSDCIEINTYYLYKWANNENADCFFAETNGAVLNSVSLDNQVSVYLNTGGVGKLKGTKYWPSPSFVTNALKADSANVYRTAALADGRTITWRDDSSTATNYANVSYRNYDSRAIDVACGNNHSLVRLQDGSLVTWWDSFTGTYNGGTNGFHDITDVTAIAVGQDHNLALQSNGTVAVWGNNDHKQTNMPQSVVNVIAVDAGYWHSSALRSNGKVIVWGSDNFCQLSTNAAYVTNAVQVACGAHHCIARLASATNVYAWGFNCGDSDSSGQNYYRTNFSFISKVVAVRAGGYGSAIIFEDGKTVMHNVRQPRYLRTKDCLPFSNGEAVALAGTNPLNADSDGDGLPDGWELRFGCNPLSQLEIVDPDGDGLSNIQEYNYGTNPNSADGDGDGLFDGEEYAAGSDAFNPDTDGDGLLDGYEVKRYGSSPVLRDTDGDGLPDYDEARRYGTSPSRADSDYDGLADAEEVLTFGTNPNAGDSDGDLLPDKWEIDNAQDGYDPLDPTDAGGDSDSDGLPENWEMAFFGNPTAGEASADSDYDGVSNLDEYLAKTDPTNSLSVVKGLPLGWHTCDLGTPARIGGASCAGGIFTVVGGYSTDGAADAYRICGLPVWGNFTFTARMVSLGADGDGGIFVRSSEDPSSVKMELMTNSIAQIKSLTRLCPAAVCIASNHVAPAWGWLRITRSGSTPISGAGSTYTFESSANGSSWTTLRTISGFADMGVETLVGLFARSSQSGSLSSVSFTDVSISNSGYAPFTLASDTGCLFNLTNTVAIQPLETGLVFNVATSTNSSNSYASYNVITNLASVKVTNTVPAFVRVYADRTGFSSTYKSLFVSNRHLNGWNAYYYPLVDNAWPTFTSTNLAWVSHVPSEDFDPSGNVAGGLWKNHVAVRLQTTLPVPCTVNSGTTVSYVFKVEWVGAARVSLERPSDSTVWVLPEKPDSSAWQSSVITNTSIGCGLNNLIVDLKSWDGPAGVRLWWRPLYDPVFKRILPADCFVGDYNTNGYSDAAENWQGANLGLGVESDADGDGISDLAEALTYHTNPFDPGSKPLEAVTGLQYEDTTAGLVACGFKDGAGIYARLYDQTYPYSVTGYVGSVSFFADASFGTVMPSNPTPSGLKLEGFFFAEAEGWYDFKMLADDRATLEFDGVPLVSVVTPGSKVNGAYLMAGLHTLWLSHENRSLGKRLELSYRRSGGEFGLVPGRLLRRMPSALANAQSRRDTDCDGIPDVIDEDDFDTNAGADTDGDGVSDEEERTVSRTDPFVADISTNYVWHSVISGEDGRSALGEWFPDSGGLYCATRNGTAEFTISTGESGFFWIDLYGREYSEYADMYPFCMELSVDEASCGKQTFDVPVGSVGSCRFYTPYLTSGTHTVKVRWINALERHSLFIERLVVTLPGGGDGNVNGMADWVETRMTNLLAVVAPTRSHTSPVCLEGADAGCMEATVIGGFPTPADHPEWVPEKRRLPGNAWYADVPLATGGVTLVTAGFADAPVSSTCAVEWVALNVAACREISVRQNETLKFWAAALGANALTATLETNMVKFTVGTNAQDLATNIVTVACTNSPAYFTFGQSGKYIIRAAWTNGSVGYTLETRVDVAGASFSRDPLLIVGKETEWLNLNLSSNLWIESDSHLLLAWGKANVFKATLQDERTAYVSARLYENGPVLATAVAEPFVFTTHNEAGYMKYLYSLPDGTRVFEGRITVLDLRPDFTVTLSFLSSANYFEDSGSWTVTFTADDFDENGELVFKMYIDGTSFCHRLYFNQGNALIKSY